MLIKGKKAAGEMVISPWMILNFAIIGIVIVTGILIFLAAQADVRDQEAEILATGVLDCLSEKFSLTDLSANFIFENCNLDRKVIEGGDYYIRLTVSRASLSVSEMNERVGEPIRIGVNWDTECDFQEKQGKEKNFPQCAEKSGFILGKDNEYYVVEVRTASNQR